MPIGFNPSEPVRNISKNNQTTASHPLSNSSTGAINLFEDQNTIASGLPFVCEALPYGTYANADEARTAICGAGYPFWSYNSSNGLGRASSDDDCAGVMNSCN